MPVRGLLDFLRERRLIFTESLANLKGTKVAVDGSVWLKKLVINEPFQVATGGAPLTLGSLVKAEIDKYTNNKIKPLFVFSGLNLKKEKPTYVLHDTKSKMRLAAWEHFLKGNIELSSETFARNGNLLATFVPNILQYLHQFDVEFFRAPYLSWAQLAWFDQNPFNLVHGTFGGLEVLLFGVTKLIIDIDFNKGTFDWVDQRRILDDLGLTHEQFVDTCILAGFDYCSTFPPLLDDQFNFRAASEMVRNFRTGYDAVQGHIGHPNLSKTPYLDIFLRTKVLVRNHLIYGLNCRCELLHPENCPSDLHEIIGPRLPNEVYFFLSQGIISSQVINNLLGGYLIEAPPLLDSEEYRTALDKLLDIRTKTIGLLTSCLHPFYKKRRVITIRWFDVSNETDLEHSQHHNEFNELLRVNFVDSDVKAEMKRQKVTSEQVDPHFVLSFVKERTNVPLLENHFLVNDPSLAVNSMDQLLTILYVQFFTITGYVSFEAGLTGFGRSLFNGDSKGHHEALITACELLRSSYTLSNKFTLCPPSQQQPDPPHHAPEILLVSKIATLVRANLKEKYWEGPIDQDLMAFNSVVKAIYRSLRNLLEILLLFLFMKRKLNVPHQDFIKISFRLPFFQEETTATGILVKHFLQGNNLEELTTTFTSFVDVKTDLLNFFTFWTMMMPMAEELHKSKHIEESIWNTFQSANKLILARRKETNL